MQQFLNGDVTAYTICIIFIILNLKYLFEQHKYVTCPNL